MTDLSLRHKIIHAKRVLLALYPLDPWYSIHSSLVSSIVRTDFSSTTFVCVEFTIEQVPDVFVTTDVFKERFERLFRHTLPHTQVGPLARRCRSLFLRGMWSTVSTLRVLRVLDAPLSVLCVHALDNEVSALWRDVVKHRWFQVCCTDSLEVLVVSAHEKAKPACLPLLELHGSLAWRKLHTLIVYDCGSVERHVPAWISSNWHRFPKLQRVYVLGVAQPPRATDFTGARVHVAPLSNLGDDQAWPPSTTGLQDYAVTCEPRIITKPPLQPASGDEKHMSPLQLPSQAVSGDVSTDASETVVYEPLPATRPQHIETSTINVGIRHVLQQLEERHRRDRSTRLLEQRRRRTDAVQQNKQILREMLDKTSRHVRSHKTQRQQPLPGPNAHTDS